MTINSPDIKNPLTRNFSNTFLSIQQERKTRIEHYLDNFLSPKNYNSNLLEPIRYTILNPGKRIRPLLVYFIGESLGADLQRLDAPAAAVELIHCYSLVHDDLPAMDNDDLRRGKPTCHKAYNEATAILVGDALQSLAFEVLSDTKTNTVPAVQQIKMVQILARAAGLSGMVDGQYMDMEGSQKKMTIELLNSMHQKKTGALIQAAVQLGAVAASCEDQTLLSILQNYAEHLGLAFQVQDDILDVEGTVEALGKNPGQDEANQKQTFTTLLGIEGAKDYMHELYKTALLAIEVFDKTTNKFKKTPETNNTLLKFTQYLLHRGN